PARKRKALIDEFTPDPGSGNVSDLQIRTRMGGQPTEGGGGATLTKFDKSVHGKFQGIADLAAYNRALKPKKKYICSFPGYRSLYSSAAAQTPEKQSTILGQIHQVKSSLVLPLNQKKAAANVCKKAHTKKAPAKKAPTRAPSDEKPRAKEATEPQTPEPKRARRSRKQVR
ncbi:hypothetical protein THAOC_10843, partial [Thalassiosira oceanica]